MKFKHIFFSLFISYFSTTVVANPVDLANQDKTLQVEVVSPSILQANEDNEVTLKIQFKETGKPAGPEALKTVHTEKVHLLINNPNLSDYHHVHPTPGKNSGEYVFTFKPSSNTHYRIWADLVPVDGEQEYVIVDLKGERDSALSEADKQFNQVDTVNGRRYELSLEPGEIRVNGMAMGTITVKDEQSGEAFTGLEPVMEEFAHLVGFYEDFITIAHIHPMGPTPEHENDRGGPEVKFHVGANQPGFMKLYKQVQIDGQQQFASFGLMVKENS